MEKFMIVCDNALGHDENKKISDIFLSLHFPWFFHYDVLNSTNQLDDVTLHAFRHALWMNNECQSNFASVVDSLITKMMELTGGKLVALPKVVVNLTMNHGIQNGNMAHCDGMMDLEVDGLKRYTGVYYLNESDGDTLIYDDDGITVVDAVSPKADRLIVFPSRILHSRQLPLNHTIRAVVNLNTLVSHKI
jgi:hypothetical protein